MARKRIALTQLGTHFVQEGDDFRLFKIEECENCGGEAEAANSCRVRIVGGAKTLEAYGLKPREKRLPEQFWDDGLEHCACEDCR